MKTVSVAFLAGFMAAAVISAVLLTQSWIGMTIEADIIGVLTSVLTNWLSSPAAATAGWAIHFTVGSLVYGFAFATWHRSLPGDTDVAKGVALGLLGWAVVVLLLIPAGRGLFGLQIGYALPVATFVIHIVFGATLGGFHHILQRHSTHDRHLRATH